MKGFLFIGIIFFGFCYCVYLGVIHLGAERAIYRFQNETVVCNYSYVTECGLAIWGCENGKEYNCVRDVSEEVAK